MRIPEPADGPRIAEIHFEAWRRFYKRLVPAEVIEERTLEIRQRQWREKLADPPEREIILVAEADGEVIGFMTGIPSPYPDRDAEKVVNLNAVYLDPARIREGVAAALYTRFVQIAEELGYEELEGQVYPDNDRSRGFFRDRGWVLDGHEQVVNGAVEWRAGRPVAGALDQTG